MDTRVCFGAVGVAATATVFCGDVTAAASLVAIVSLVAAGDVARAAGALAATTGARLAAVAVDADVVTDAVVEGTGRLAAAASFGVVTGMFVGTAPAIAADSPATSSIAAGFTVSGPLYGAAGVASGVAAATAGGVVVGATGAVVGVAATAGCNAVGAAVATGAVDAAGFGDTAGASGQAAAGVCVDG